MIYLATYTSIAASLFLTFSLKMLSIFKFIKWNPIGFTKNLFILEDSHPLIQWLFLVFIIFVVTFILYIIMQFVELVPAFLTSLILGAIIALVIEWIIFDLPAELSSFKKLSIPFMVIIVMTARFVFETAVFHYKASKEENKLPYNDSMIQ